MQPRMVGLIGVLALATGWYAATVVSPASQAPASPSQRGGPRPLGRPEAPAPLTEELHTRLRALPRSPTPGRNPFVFSARVHAPSASSAPSRAEAPAEGASAAVAAPPPSPRFQLSGIASSHVDGAAVLTAILTDNGALVLAKAGDRLTGGYQVVRVEETAVVLVNDAGAELTVRLR